MYNNLSFTKPKPGIQLNRAHPLAQGLVACWLFNEESGTVTRDVTTGKPGTLNNFAFGGSSTSGWTGSRFGGGLMFDGTDDHVNIGNVLHPYIDYNKPFSVIIWFSLSTLSSNHPELLGSHYTRQSPHWDAIELRLANTTIQYYEVWFRNAPTTTTSDGFYFSATPSSGFAVNTPYNVALVYDGSNSYAGLNLYHNGALLSKSGTDSGAITQSMYQPGRLLDQPFLIGARYNGSLASFDIPFPGMIHSVRVYNRVLSKSEIQTLYLNPYIDFHSDNLFMTNPTLYGLGAWKGNLINAGASGTLTADSVDNNVEAAMALSFKKA